MPYNHIENDKAFQLKNVSVMQRNEFLVLYTPLAWTHPFLQGSYDSSCTGLTLGFFCFFGAKNCQ
jgi:hypothetical protein